MAGGSFLNNYLPYVLRRADQTLSAPFYDVLARAGVARSDWRVLAVLHEHGEMSVLALAEEALSPQPTVTHALRRLEERGLVKRKAGTVDKRQRFVTITATGAKLTSALIAEALELESAALAGSGDLTELVEQLRQLTERIETQLTDLPAESEAG